MHKSFHQEPVKKAEKDKEKGKKAAKKEEAKKETVSKREPKAEERPAEIPPRDIVYDSDVERHSVYQETTRPIVIYFA